MNLRFYHCDICGKVITILSDTGVPTVCCGKTMREIIPNRTDGASEKHVPACSLTGNTVLVRIGSAPHPMTDKHSITWIGLRTDEGFRFKELLPGDLPEAVFLLAPEEQVEAVYAFCNLHGLWCKEAKCDE